MEIWKDIEGFEGKYMISDHGRIKSLTDYKGRARELIRKPRIAKNGYYYVNLFKKSKCKSKKPHRLVAEAFIHNPFKKETVNHINGIKTDNRVENLEWATQKENSEHAYRTKLAIPTIGERNGMYGKHGEENPNSRAVNQYDINGNFIKTWINVKIASETLKIHHIAACARGVRKSAGGFIWRYV